MRTTEPGLLTFVNILTPFIVVQLESVWTSAIVGPFGIHAASSLAHALVFQAFVNIFAVVPEGGCSVALVTDTEEGALRVPALPVGAEVLVLALVDIFALVLRGGRLVALPTGAAEGALAVLALPIHAQIPLLAFINIFAVLVVWSRAVALVTGAHVGAFKVGASAVGADLWFQALIHVETLPVPSTEPFRAGDTLVRPRRIHTLLTRTSTWSQTFINILTVSLRGHAVTAVAVFALERPHRVDAVTFPTHVWPQALIHIYAVSTLLAGHESSWANTQETSLCVFTTPLGAEVLGLRAFVNINTFPLSLAEFVSLVAYAGVPHRQVDAVPSPTDVGVHSTLIDFCYLSGRDNLAGA